jgi:hypothetical protein
VTYLSIAEFVLVGGIFKDEMGEAVERMLEMRNAYNILVRKLNVKDHLEDTGVDEEININDMVRRCGLD